MELCLWFVVGAIAGYVVGMRLFEDGGLGVGGHIVLGCVGGIVGGLAGAVVTGVADPVDSFSLITIAGAVTGAIMTVLLVNLVAERAELGA